MDDLLPLLEMGFDRSDLDVAFARGCRTAEDAVEFLTENRQSAGNAGSNHLVLSRPNRPNSSMFTLTRPFYVNLTDAHWPEPPRSHPEEANPVQHAPGEQPLKKPSLDNFGLKQDEARRMAQEIHEERLAREDERQRLRSLIEADKQAKRELSSHTESALHPEPSQGRTVPGKPDMIRIRVSIQGSQLQTTTLNFPLSSVYANLMSEIQSLLSSHCFKSDSSVTDELKRHYDSLKVTDSCVELVLNTWPRRQLPRCPGVPTCEGTSLSSDETDLGGQRLINLGLTDGASITVRHANCPLERPAEPDEPMNDASRPVQPEPEVPDERFPPGGQQLIPQPPGGILPPNRFDPRENIRQGALRLEEKMRQTKSQMNVPKTPDIVSWRSVDELTTLCLRRLLRIIVHYTQAVTSGSARLGSLSPATWSTDRKSGTKDEDIAFAAEHRIVQSLSGSWPESLGQLLIRQLCGEHQFNPLTATILRNSVTRLNLDNYVLATNDLVTCLAYRWPDLIELRMDGLQSGQVSSESLKELSNLQHLRVLSLNRLSNVCDINLRWLVDLPSLRVLRISGTKVTDAGWLDIASSCHAGEGGTAQPGQVRHLIQLDASHLPLSDQSILAIAVIYPELRILNLSATEITGNPQSIPSSVYQSLGIDSSSHYHLAALTQLDLSDCLSLLRIPSVLIPELVDLPSSPSSDYTASPMLNYCQPRGLRILRVNRCSQLPIGQLLDDVTGQPIRRLDGLETLSGVDAASLKEFFERGFPLTEVSLRGCNFSWMVADPSITAHILSCLSPTSLSVLSLPRRPIRGDPSSAENQQRMSEALSGLRRFHNLQLLDVGAQISTGQDAAALASALRHLSKLKQFTAIDIPPDLQQTVRDACQTGCVVHIQSFL
ncbi:unnamed protein product [Calicophoron daubneyi]|uniref:UBA domain-containing protein n=1 Tax=Calicophoron daubneyi TaxID=300641 RepID=A0AAV2TY55_CALDB